MKPEILTYEQAKKINADNDQIVLESKIELYIEELFDIENPQKKDTKTDQELSEYKEQLYSGRPPSEWGVWVYYPWLSLCLHIPEKPLLRSLRTSRNRNLITSEEQAQLYASTLLIAGMSVGSNIVEALVSQGIGGKLILADMDIIEPSNLNRIRSPLHHVGLHKVEAISRKVWEMDPFIEIVQLTEGITGEVLAKTLEENNVNIVIDEVDALDMKIAIREYAKPKGIPVIMAADDGDDALLDIERYDQNPNLELFNGLIPDEILNKIKDHNLERREIGQVIGKYFVGPEHIPVRMYESLFEVGKSLPSWPQLGGAAALSGVSLAYVAKKILLGQQLLDGRILISLDEKLSERTAEDQQKIKKYQKMMFGL